MRRQNRLLTVIVLLSILAVLAANIVYAASRNVNLVYVSTDMLDEKFLSDGFKMGLLPSGPVVGLNSVAAVHTSLIVLPDPNWGSRNLHAAAEASKAMISFIEHGARAVVGLNGAVLLNLTLRKVGLPLPPTSDSAAAWLPKGYNVSLYRWLPRSPWMASTNLSCGLPAYYFRLGDGWVVILPVNVVWAYSSTRDVLYLRCTGEAIKLAERLPSGRAPRGPAFIAAVMAGVAVAAAAVASQQRSGDNMGQGEGHSGQDGSAATGFLGIRLNEEEAKAHPLRRRILEVLETNGAAHFNELWRLLGGSKATLAWHISLLERLKLVATIRYKKYLIIYRTGPAGIEALFRSLAARDQAFCRLVRLVERNVNLEEAALKLRVSKAGLRDIYALVRERLEVARRVCGAV